MSARIAGDWLFIASTTLLTTTYRPPERFKAQAQDHSSHTAFQLVLAKSQKTVEVGADESPLEALERIGIDHPYACREGLCGTCEVRVLEGQPDHKDNVLSEQDLRRVAAEVGLGAVPLDDLLKTGVHDKPDVSALAACSGKRITVLVWHYHDDDVPGLNADITLDLKGTPDGNPKVTRTLIDRSHSNAFTAWQTLGSPQTPNAEQIYLMELASKLATATDKTEVKSKNKSTTINFSLARQGVTLVELEWP